MLPWNPVRLAAQNQWFCLSWTFRTRPVKVASRTEGSGLCSDLDWMFFRAELIPIFGSGGVAGFTASSNPADRPNNVVLIPAAQHSQPELLLLLLSASPLRGDEQPDRVEVSSARPVSVFWYLSGSLAAAVLCGSSVVLMGSGLDRDLN